MKHKILKTVEFLDTVLIKRNTVSVDKKNCETHYRGEELLFLEHISSYIVDRC